MTDDLFEQLFAIFPQKRKGTRRMAYPKWLAAIKRDEPEVILAGAKAYAESNPGEFAKNLPSWLHNDMWTWDWTPAKKSTHDIGYFERNKTAGDEKVYGKLKTRQAKGEVLEDSAVRWIMDYEARDAGVR